MSNADLTVAEVRRLLDYCPETGVFRWRRAPFAVAGQVAEAGYRRITINRRRYRAHRLAWFYVHGRWPAETLDHINGARDDNRIVNLREASLSLNAQNLREAKSHNRSGYLGVYWHAKNKWIARITVAGKTHTLGTGFAHPAEAHAAYLQAKRQMHPGCTI